MGVRDLRIAPSASGPDMRGRRQLYRFIEQAPLSIAMFDTNMRYLAYSRSWRMEYGRGFDDLAGLCHYTVHPDIKEDWKAIHRRALAGETVRNEEDCWKLSDGSQRWLRWAVVPWHDELGSIGGIVISAEDISERKQIELVLSENEARLAGIINAATDAVVTVDEHMRITLFNPAAEQVFGYRAQQIQGKSLDILIPQGLRQLHRAHVDKFARGGTTSRSMASLGELRALRADGREIHIEASISKSVVGGRPYFTAIARDISQRKQLLEEISRSEQRMELALDGANLAIWDFDVASGKFNHSPRLIEMLGYKVGEIEVNRESFRANLHPDDSQRFTDAFRDHITGSTARFAIEYRLRHKDGHWVWIISRGRVVQRDGDGFAIRVTGTNLDISERKAAEETERRLNRAFKFLSQCDSLLVHAQDEFKLLAAICKLSVEIGGYVMAWVGFAQDDTERTVLPVTSYGDRNGYLKDARISWGDTQRGRGPSGTAIREVRSIVIQDFNTNSTTGPWQEAARVRGYRSSIALPLIVNRRAIGALMIYSGEPYAFGADEVALLQQLADDISFGIQALRDRDEHEKARLILKRESEKNQALLRNASDGIHIVDMNGKLLEASDSFCEMLGYARAEIIGKDISLWDANFSDAERADLIAQQFRHPGRSQFDTVHRRKDGTTFDVEVSGHPIELDGGTVLFNSSRDITERKRTQNSLRESETRLRTIIEQSPIGMAFARDGVTVDVNAVYLQMFGYSDASELRGKSLLRQIAPQCRGEIEQRIARRRQGEAVETSYETLGLRKDGSQFPVFISAKRLELQDGPVTFAFLMDITRQKESELEIQRLAFHDHLTNLPNRRLLQDRLQQALAASERSGKRGALLFIDLDDFKSLNDTMGHATGDALLQQVASRLQSSLRQGDSVARLGGDEFVVLLEDLSTESVEAASQAEAISKKIFATLARPYWLGTQLYHCTTSIGATLFVGNLQGREELIKQADIAMYEAKRAGRNSFRFFDPQMQEAINSQTSLRSELRQALLRDQFLLHYQIQVDEFKRPLGAEVLIRWEHPTRGLVSPAQFVPLAEESELIFPIGQWVLETACAQLKTWERKAQTRALHLCVNVSAKQFHSREFVSSVRSTIQSQGINPQLLVLELTESMLLKNVEETIATMHALGELGVRFSLDDFGTGYSSLGYLKRLPLRQLKIDQSFVREIATNSSDLAIVKTIIAMADSLHLDVIAEGVETQEQRQLLLAMGCKEYQGYLFGRPMPIQQFEESLAAFEPAIRPFYS